MADLSCHLRQQADLAMVDLTEFLFCFTFVYAIAFMKLLVPLNITELFMKILVNIFGLL